MCGGGGEGLCLSPGVAGGHAIGGQSAGAPRKASGAWPGPLRPGVTAKRCRRETGFQAGTGTRRKPCWVYTTRCMSSRVCVTG